MSQQKFELSVSLFRGLSVRVDVVAFSQIAHHLFLINQVASVGHTPW